MGLAAGDVGVAILTMVVGSIVALTQTDMKRMLAYSSIAHAGFILVGVIAADAIGTVGVLFYLAAYGFATVGAFAVVTLVRDAGGEATHLSQWAGLGKRSPLLAAIFALFLLAFAGIPLTSGFVGKFAVFTAAVDGGGTPLVVVGVVASADRRVLLRPGHRADVLHRPGARRPDRGRAERARPPSRIAVGVAATVVLGVLPGPLLDLAPAGGPSSSADSR